MRILSLLGAISVATAVALPVAPAQERTDAGRTAELPLKPTRNVRFTSDEGTWMSLDVSPDGRTIVFDLVGDIYTVPITGGKATRITDGMAMDVQPRWSPDGRQIVFVSDRDGSDDVWVIDANGRNPRQITKTDSARSRAGSWPISSSSTRIRSRTSRTRTRFAT